MRHWNVGDSVMKIRFVLGEPAKHPGACNHKPDVSRQEGVLLGWQRWGGRGVGAEEGLERVDPECSRPVPEHVLERLNDLGVIRGHLAGAGVEEAPSISKAPRVVPTLAERR